MVMDHTYANGTINLAGVEAQNSDGLSVPRDLLRVNPCFLPCGEMTWLASRHDDMRSNVDRSPLSKR